MNGDRAADGGWITVTSVTRAPWRTSPRLLGLDTSRYETQESRVTGTHEPGDGSGTWIAHHSTEDGLEAMEEAGVVVEKVVVMDDVLADPERRRPLPPRNAEPAEPRPRGARRP